MHAVGAVDGVDAGACSHANNAVYPVDCNFPEDAIHHQLVPLAWNCRGYPLGTKRGNTVGGTQVRPDQSRSGLQYEIIEI